jgi:sulfatase modifying factor 1
MSAARPEDWRRRGPASFPPRWASVWGDDRCGLWADLAVADVVQRLRWIEAGRFQMGDERQSERQVETPIVAGFWLADTACTQALWRAVIGGSNPSRFSEGNTEHPGSPQHPVEQVSWNDIALPSSGFLARLQRFSQGVPPELPSEAEWEYACRAGTRTAYSFGDEVTPAQANYRGSREPAIPLAVKSLPANAWGLHEMHGNVWEWCADGYDVDGLPTTASAEANAALRAQRGGSWGSPARDVRAADRLTVPPATSNQFTGFRFLLRN